MPCGCQGGRWQAPTPADAEKIRRGERPAPVERTRELIPGGYWNGPKAKQKQPK